VATGELQLKRIGLGHHAPIVDRAGRARRDAIHAVIADRGIDHIIVAVMRHRIDRTCLFAGVAANAYLGIDQVLLQQLSNRRVHGLCLNEYYAFSIFTYSKSPGLLSMPTRGGEIQLANLPGSVSAFISDSMKSPSDFDGR